MYGLGYGVIPYSGGYYPQSVGVPTSSPPESLEDLLGIGSFNGFAWGPGSPCVISSISGLSDLPAISSFDALRGYDHGEIPGVDFMQGRDVTIEFLIRANTLLPGDNAQFYDMLNTMTGLKSAFIPQTNLLSTATELPLYLFNNQRVILCRVRKRAVDYHADYVQGFVKVATMVHCTDPRVYDANLQSFSVTSAAPNTNGRTYPTIYPIVYGSGPGTEIIVATNQGSFTTRPQVVVQGPCINPQIINGTTGLYVQFNIQLLAGDSLAIDFDSQTASLNGSGDRTYTLAQGSTWWELLPGVNTVRYNSTAVPPIGSSMALSFRNAWV